MTAAVTVAQPTASLVAEGVVTALPRAKAAPAGLVGGRMLIHAGSKRPRTTWVRADEDPPAAVDLVAMSRYWEWTEDVNDYSGGGAYRWVGPLGAIVASATLTACAPIGGPYDFRTGLVEGDEGDYPGQPVVVLQPAFKDWVSESLTLDNADGTSHDISDQLLYGDWSPGRWALLLEDVKPTTQRCPECWGRGTYLQNVTCAELACSVCDGSGLCPPVPARGRPGVWEWTP